MRFVLIGDRRYDVKREQANAGKLTEVVLPFEGVRLGRIACINESGAVLVDFPGNIHGPIAARITSSAKAGIIRRGNPEGREVLLAFENSDPKLPVIVDAMYSLIEEITESGSAVVEEEELQEVTIDGKRISFEAEEEIVLKCGKASITITKAGKVLIKGDYVLSHSSGENRVRGGSVSIN
jgi:hypothetical protein